MQNLKTPYLFELSQDLPDGFLYMQDLLTVKEEHDLLKEIQNLTFEEFIFHGYSAKRKVIHWGWFYDFQDGNLKKADPIPEFLLPARVKAAHLADLKPSALTQALVTEYPVGSLINWQRDAPAFETIVGISLLSPCEFRLKPYRREKATKKILKIHVEPRSGYVLAGKARNDYQHSTAPVKEVRYSITFRTLRPETVGALTMGNPK